MDEKKILNAIEDQEFLAKVLNMDSVEDVQAAFKQDKDIDITAEDLEAIQKIVEEKMEGELSEDDLENVAGGVDVNAIVTIGEAVVNSFISLGKAVHEWTRRRW